LTSGEATDQPDPGARALSTYLAAIGIALSSSLLTEWLALVSVVALELGSTLSIVLVQSVSGGPTERKTPPVVEQITERQAETRSEAPKTAPTVENPGQNDREPDPTPPGKRTHRNAKRRLGDAVWLVRDYGGKVTASQQSMARQLGLSKTQVAELLRELEAAGHTKLHNVKGGQVYPRPYPRGGSVLAQES
jgi:hypothetical protein